MNIVPTDRYIKGSTPLVTVNIDKIEYAIKNGKGARYDMGNGEHAEAVKSHTGQFYVKLYKGKAVYEKSPKTSVFAILKAYMEDIAPYHEWEARQ